MKKILLLVLTYCFALFLIGVNAQKAELLSASDSKKIARADKKINKGDLIVEKKEKYTSQIEELENSDGRIRTGKIERLETKANKEIIKSSSYYKEGYGKKYKAYKKAVNRGLKNESLSSDAHTIKSHAVTAYKNGRKWRRKSSSKADVDKAVDYLLKANGVEEDAIKSLAKILESVDEVAVEEVEQVQDSLVEMSDTASVEAVLLAPKDTMLTVIDSSATSTMVDSTLLSPELAIDTSLVKEDAVVVETEKSKELLLYFSVQVLADKQPVPKEKVVALYNGPLEVVKHETDGWYRYSIGKFRNLGEAKEMMAKSGVKGYVVAYHNEKRISTRQAMELMEVE